MPVDSNTFNLLHDLRADIKLVKGNLEMEAARLGRVEARVCQAIRDASSAPSGPSPIVEITPDVAALFVRLEALAGELTDPHTPAWMPERADDIRRACELIRFGRAATGQPDAGKGVDRG